MLFFPRRDSYKIEDGLSLLEIIIAVAIVAIFTVIGIIAFQSFTDNARQAAVDRAANEVFTASMAAQNTPGGKPLEEVIEEFNNTSRDDIEAEVTHEGQAFTITVRGWDDRYITVRSTSNTDEIDNETPGNTSTEFLDNPSLLPDTIAYDTSGTIKERAFLYSQEIKRRSDLYAANYDSIEGEDAYTWQMAVIGGQEGVQFNDPDYGTFIATAFVGFTSSQYNEYFIAVAAPDGNVYYQLYSYSYDELDAVQKEMLNLLNAQPF